MYIYETAKFFYDHADQIEILENIEINNGMYLCICILRIYIYIYILYIYLYMLYIYIYINMHTYIYIFRSRMCYRRER
jgi:hypothetical protein